MNRIQTTIKELELINQRMQDEIMLLKQANQALIEDKKSLKAFIKEKELMINGYVRQGIRYQDITEPYFGVHYYVIKVEGIPLSLNILDVQELIKEVVQESLDEGGKFEGYLISKFDYSSPAKAWFVQIEKVIDMKRNDI